MRTVKKQCIKASATSSSKEGKDGYITTFFFFWDYKDALLIDYLQKDKIIKSEYYFNLVECKNELKKTKFSLIQCTRW